jgi:rhodanese-related sulfurtransferase
VSRSRTSCGKDRRRNPQSGGRAATATSEHEYAVGFGRPVGELGQRRPLGTFEHLGFGHAAGQAYLTDVERIVRLYFTAKDGLEPVPAAELLERAKRGLVTVLDVRPPEEFAAGHLPGAVNIPIHELTKRLTELPKRREIVAYCRGPYCLMSYDAVQLLRTKGLKARRLEAGLPEWRLAGMPTVVD